MVRWPKIETSLPDGPNGITAIAMKAGMAATIGASTYTTLSARLTTRSSFSISLMPSASDWSMPQGPCRLGPMRSCIQATTLRSHTMEKSTVTIRNAKQNTALMTTSHHGSVPNIDRSSAASTALCGAAAS